MTDEVEENLDVNGVRSCTVVKHRKKRRGTVLEGKSTTDCNACGGERGIRK
jgi:hypothetical protein